MTGAAGEDLHGGGGGGGGQIGLLMEPPSSHSVLPSITSLLTEDGLGGVTASSASMQSLSASMRRLLVNTRRRTRLSSHERIELKLKAWRELMRNTWM